MPVCLSMSMIVCLSVYIRRVCMCMSGSAYVCLSVCLSVCVDSTKTSSRRAVTTWSFPRHSSHRARRRPNTAAAAAAAAVDVIDDDDDMDDDSITYVSLPADIKPPEWFLTSVSL